MSYNKKISDTHIRIGEVRFSYCNVFVPRKQEDGSDGKYSICILIPKSDQATVDLVNSAIEKAKLLGKDSKWGGKIPTGLKLPIMKDGDIDSDDPNFAGHWYFNASSASKPDVKLKVDGSVTDALDAEDFYSGCYGCAFINFYPFANQSKGVAAGLNGVIKLRDGERLSGGGISESDYNDL